MDIDFSTKELNLTEELKQYQDGLQKAAELDSTILLSNGGVEHAAILLSAIFGNANKEIDIYGSTLREELTSYDIYINSLKRCIEKNVTVRILLESQKENEKSPARKWLEKLSAERENVIVKDVVGVADVMCKYLKNATHFTIADGKMFRLEYDVENFKAFGSLNGPAIVSVLKAAFENTFNDSGVYSQQI